MKNIKVGYVGLGLMGGPISSNLAKAGVDLYVNDQSKEKMKEIAALGAKAVTKKEMAENCDIVAMILPNADIVMDVIFGEDGIAKYMKKGGLIIDQSSVSPEISRKCRDRLKEYGIRFMDAPVSGGPVGAKSKAMAIMCGGSQEDFDFANEAVFKHIGNGALLIGDIGAGNICKLANQIIVNNNMAIVAEAMVFAKKAGVNPEKVFNAIRGGAAGSWILDTKAPCIFDREFKAGGSITVMLKDVGNVIDTAKTVDAVVPYTANYYEILKYLRVHGYAEKDFSVVVRYYEELTGVTLEK